MKKIICMLVALCVCMPLCFSLSSCSSESAHTGFKIISTDINDFRLEVPTGWTATSQNGIVSATADGLSGDKSNISVMSTMLNGPQTEQEYFKLLLDSYLEMYDSLRISYSDKWYDIIPTPAEDKADDSSVDTGAVAAQADETTDTSADTSADETAPTLTTKQAAEKYVEIDFGTEKGARYVFEAKVLGESYRFMQVFAIHTERLYIFTYTSNEEFYETHKIEVEYIISYFEFKV